MKTSTIISLKRTLFAILLVLFICCVAMIVGSSCAVSHCPAYDKYHSVHKYYGMSDKVMYYSPNDYNHGRTRY